jgi:two-component system cell cycle response regulator
MLEQTKNEESYQELEKRAYDLKTLINLGISLSSNLEFESLVESILYSCIGQMVVEKVAILLQVDIDVSNYYIHMAKGYDLNLNDHGILFQTESPIIKFLEGFPVVHEISELKKIKELEDDILKIEILDPQIIVPMKSKNSLNGILILSTKITGEEYQTDEKEFLKLLAKFAAIAVENSRLYLMATLDRMTRLYIHHYFQERLSDEMRRSVRLNSPLCLIMSDIDNFKKFNDAYGHQQGDIVLKETAKIFKTNIRAIDIPARYGGEEFAVILPETKIDDGILIATRIRKAIEIHEFSGQIDPLNVTMSFGVAQYDPLKDKSKNDLIEKADSSLYKAKESGRNKVVAHK